MEYDDQLDRALDDTADVADSTGRLSLPDPELRQEGNATVYENFQGTLSALDRTEAHLMRFLQDELGTSASIDDRGRLRLTGEFQERRIQGALEEYVEGYVRCPECGLPDTRIETENGAEVLRCEACGAQSPAGG